MLIHVNVGNLLIFLYIPKSKIPDSERFGQITDINIVQQNKYISKGLTQISRHKEACDIIKSITYIMIIVITT